MIRFRSGKKAWCGILILGVIEIKMKFIVISILHGNIDIITITQ